jgi:isopenicillin N synthase-like dioxygenase
VVHFHAGGLPGSRPILKGEHAKETFNRIPVIDMSGMFSESIEDRKQVAREVGKASREIGFFYAQNHGVPDEIVSTVFETITEFFARPHKNKMEIHINKSVFFRGYEPLWETRLDPTSRGGLLPCSRNFESGY